MRPRNPPSCASSPARTSGCVGPRARGPDRRAGAPRLGARRRYRDRPGPLTDYVPVCLAPQEAEAIITQYDMVALEQVGMLKIDVLGLRTLTVIHDAVRMIAERHGVTLDMNALDLEDPQFYQLLCSSARPAYSSSSRRSPPTACATCGAICSTIWSLPTRCSVPAARHRDAPRIHQPQARPGARPLPAPRAGGISSSPPTA